MSDKPPSLPVAIPPSTYEPEGDVVTEHEYAPGPVFTQVAADAFPSEANAGESTCPICSRTWLVTPWADCFLPACGCYGSDASTGDRPCEGCGMNHTRTCPKMSRPAAAGAS